VEDAVGRHRGARVGVAPQDAERTFRAVGARLEADVVGVGRAGADADAAARLRLRVVRRAAGDAQHEVGQFEHRHRPAVVERLDLRLHAGAQRGREEDAAMEE
jgi:hypothetical protein